MNANYLTDGIDLHMIGTHFCVLQPDDLANLTSSGFSTMNPFNLYMIARRPRIMLDPASVQISDDLITGQFTVKKGDAVETHGFTLLNQLGTSQIRFESPDPNNMFYVYDENEHLLAMGKTANLLPLCRESLDELLDLEVMYIGQPYGIEGVNANPAKILDIPSIQQIYSEISQLSPDQEVWLILWSFKEMDNSPTLNLDHLSDEEEANLLKSIMEKKLSAQHCISFAEAALIKYFKPKYNNRLSYNFQSDARKTYGDCESREVGSIIIEVNTEEILSNLWSREAEPFCMHYIDIKLDSSDERKKLFEMNWNQE